MDIFSDVTVLSLEQATVLPYLTYRLAQDGANVIRLEHPVYGDPNRLVGDPLPGEERMNQYYLCINAGKKAITLNLAEPRGQQLLEQVLHECKVDIFATNTLPRGYDKLGIAPRRLRSLKPDLIWLGVTGFGPDSNEAAYDPILQGRGGLMELTGEPGGPPQVVGIPLPDMGTSEHAYGLLLKALYAREKTGEGATIHASMFASTVSWLTVPITLTATFGHQVTRIGNQHQFFAPVNVFKTKDGFVYIAVGNDRQFAALVEIPEFTSLNKPQYLKNAGRIADVENLSRMIARIMATMTSEQVIEKFRAIRLPIGKIQTIAELLDDPLVKPNLLRSADPQSGLELTLAPAPHCTPFLDSHGNTLSFPPRFGEHNAEVYGRCGVGADELDRLKEQGVI